MSETATTRHWVPATLLRTSATLSYLALAAATIITVRLKPLGPYEMVFLLVGLMALAVTFQVWVAARKLNNWHDWLGLVMILLVSRSLMHLSSGVINAVPDARAHLNNMVTPLVRTGFIPEPRRFYPTGDYHLYPVLHMNLTALIRVAGYAVYPMSAVFSLFLTLIIGVTIAASAKRWIPGLELLAVVGFATWPRLIAVGTLLQPIAIGSAFLAFLFLLLPKVPYPRTLFLFLLGAGSLALTHHYSSWMAITVLSVAIIMPHLARDLGRLLGPLPNPRAALEKIGIHPLSPAPLLRMSLPLVLYAIIIGYWTVGSDDLKAFVNYEDIFRFEQTETFAESRSVRTRPTRWVSLINFADSLLPLATIATAALVAWRTRARVAPITAGLLGFAALIAAGFIYRPFQPARVQAMAGLLGAFFIPLIITWKPLAKRLPLVLMATVLMATLAFSSVNALGYMYPWTRHEPLPLAQESPDQDLEGFLYHAIPHRPLPRSQGTIGALIFSSTGFLIYPERSVASVQWIWPPFLPDSRAQLQYWLLEDEALLFGTRAPGSLNTNEEVRNLFVRYPTEEMALVFERTRRVSDDGQYTIWYPTLE